MPLHNRTASVPDQKIELVDASAPATPWSSCYSNPNSCSQLQFSFGDFDYPAAELAQASPETRLSATLGAGGHQLDFLSPLAHSVLKLLSRRPYHQGMSPSIAAEVGIPKR
ncbi:unnamed protein product [Dibothriocephalus latus]|uniref:Uncharacterized protein n=1 Tax=Dibothriocephalus latus TaxID=60516 RepID=A0A3P7NRN8_DIBLA|nr:unnamed protein product [Dibothriocephalus latus]